MKRNDFISKALSELLDDGFSIKLPMTKSIDGKYGGWFNSARSEKEFVVAMKRDCAFEIFVHEYSHYLQWKHNTDFFNKKAHGCDVLFSWLDGTDFTDKQITKAIHNAIELEWDCERIAISLIKKHKLEIDIDNYIRGANCYLFFYHSVHKTRSWTSKGKSPYSTASRKLASTKLHDLPHYLCKDNYNEKLCRKHERICSAK